ncbi:hypothetical protein L210DRAFT_3311382, partial [Boletus edulis BED1]
VNGNDLPEGAPPLSSSSSSHQNSNPWHPFSHQAQFELANFLFCRNEMPAAQVDELMQIWARLNHDQNQQPSTPPFTSAHDLHQKIDQIDDSKTWKSFSFTYAGVDLEDECLPTWKQATYQLVVRDAKLLVQEQLACPEFKDYMDYYPQQIFGDDNQRIWSDFMSGNWAW